MALKNQAITVCYTAVDVSTGLRKTGDSANHTVYVVKDGTAAAATNAPAEVDATHAPGEYSIALTAGEMNANTVVVTGKSSTSNVEIVPAKITTERGVLPTSPAGNINGIALASDVSAVRQHTDQLTFTNASLVDSAWLQTGSDPSSVPSPVASNQAKLDFVFAHYRNQRTQDGTSEKLFKNDGVTVVATKTKSDNGTTLTVNKAT